MNKLLQIANDIEKDPSTWCQKAFARDKDGNGEMAADDPKAVSWCALGHIHKLCPDPMNRTEILEKMYAAVPPEDCISTWNDREDRTVEEVVAMFRKAAK